MILSSRIYFILTFLILIACNNFKSYSIEDLQKNSDNKLQLSVEKNFTAEKYTQLFENLKTLSKNDRAQLEDWKGTKVVKIRAIQSCFHAFARVA